MKRWYLFVILLVSVGVFPGVVRAQSLFLSPASGTHTIGQTFAVGVYTASPNQAVNAFSARLSFPTDKLQVTGLNKAGSIMSLWVQEPVFSNGEGLVRFEGIVLNPGFTGKSGKLLAITFKVKAAGVAAVPFVSGSILANDGQGTNILDGLTGGQYTLAVAGPGPAEATTPVARPGVPLPPLVKSSTHPDPAKWYADANPRLQWELPAGATGVSLTLDALPTTDPGTRSDGLLKEREYRGIGNGTWYFHLRVQNSSGWSGITHYRLRLDSEPPPPFTITLVDGAETDNPRPRLRFATVDPLSGISHYLIKVNGDEETRIAADAAAAGPIELPLLPPKRYTVVVQAVDRAGNRTTASADLTVLPLSPPVITEYPATLSRGEILTVNGTAIPRALVTVWLQTEGAPLVNWTVPARADGTFSAVYEERVRPGIYKLWAELTDARGAKSTPSVPVTVAVQQSLFLRLLARLLNYLVVVIPLLGLIALLILFILYLWKKYMIFRKRLRREVREAESGLHTAFDNLREEVRESLRLLEKATTARELTEEEARIAKELRARLDEAEKSLHKRMEKIEEEIK